MTATAPTPCCAARRRWRFWPSPDSRYWRGLRNPGGWLARHDRTPDVGPAVVPIMLLMRSTTPTLRHRPDLLACEAETLAQSGAEKHLEARAIYLPLFIADGRVVGQAHQFVVALVFFASAHFFIQFQSTTTAAVRMLPRRRRILAQRQGVTAQRRIGEAVAAGLDVAG